MITVSLFGLLEKVENPNVIIGLALFYRFIMGMANSGINTIALAYLVSIYASTLAKKIGYFEVVYGISLSAGVNVGYYIEKYLGFPAPFFIMSVLALLAIYP